MSAGHVQSSGSVQKPKPLLEPRAGTSFTVCPVRQDCATLVLALLELSSSQGTVEGFILRNDSRGKGRTRALPGSHPRGGRELGSLLSVRARMHVSRWSQGRSIQPAGEQLT